MLTCHVLQPRAGKIKHHPPLSLCVFATLLSFYSQLEVDDDSLCGNAPQTAAEREDGMKLVGLQAVGEENNPQSSKMPEGGVQQGMCRGATACRGHWPA